MRSSLFRARAVAALLAFSGIAAAGGAEDTHFTAGVRAFQSHDYALAVTELTASLDAHPTARAALYLGNAYLKQGQLGSARDELKRALDLDPKSPKRAGILALIHGIEARTEVKATVTSTPPGATVFIDAQKGTGRGKTPLDLTIHVGPHKIITALDDYDTDTREEDFVVGNPVTIAVALKPKGCDVKVSTLAPNGRASVDGGDSVLLPATVRVRKGDHKVTIGADGFAAQELPVTCVATEPITLEPVLVPTGRVKVPIAAGFTILVDGRPIDAKLIGADGRIALPIGRHEITVVAPNRAPWKSNVDVAANAEVTVTEPPPPPPPPLPPPPPPSPPPGFPGRSLYVGGEGGVNLVLRPWNLGHYAFVSVDGSRSSLTKVQGSPLFGSKSTEDIYPGSSGIGGVRIGYQLVPRFAVEAEVHVVGLPTQLDKSLGLAYGVNAVVNILSGRWTPILEGGIGVYQEVSGDLGSAEDLRGHLGVGLRGRITDWLTLRLDARDVVSQGFSTGGSNNVEALAGIELFVLRPKQ